MNILALDVSLTATGWAFNDDSGVLRPPRDSERGMARLHWIRNQVMLLAVHADIVVIEGYAFGVQGQQGHVSMGELGGVIRLALYDAATPYVEIAPKSLKLFATGKGNAPKNVVFGAAIRKLGYSRDSHDEADALWLLAMARAHYINSPLAVYEKRALDAIQWPKITTTAAVA